MLKKMIQLAVCVAAFTISTAGQAQVSTMSLSIPEVYGAERDYLLATLPVSNGGTGDAVFIQVTGITTSVSEMGILTVALGQRNGFWYVKNLESSGGYPGVLIRSYLQSNGTTNVYAIAPANAYYTAYVTYYQYGWNATLYNPATLGAEVGTLNFDSSNDTSYPINSSLTFQNGYFTGNVGIGTTAPVYPLDVHGQIRSSSGGIVFPDGTTQTTAFDSQVAFGSNSLTTTQVNMYDWAYNGLVVGNGNSGQYSGVSVGGALRNTGGPYNGFISFNNFGVNAILSQTVGALIGAVPDDTVNTDLGMGLQFMTLQSGVNVLSERMRISDNGNVGIGTTAPAAKLEVNGGLRFTSDPTGAVQTTAWTGVLCGGDYAEAVNAKGSLRTYEPGDVLVIGDGADGEVQKSAEPYSTMVAGIFATKPGVIGRRQRLRKEDEELPMAMIGIVPTKVTAENGPIHRGDLLVTSSTIGYAMKGTDRGRLFGAVIGKALGSLDSGKGVIEVLVTLQ
jgi:hypothetical protein